VRAGRDAGHARRPPRPRLFRLVPRGHRDGARRLRRGRRDRAVHHEQAFRDPLSVKWRGPPDEHALSRSAQERRMDPMEGLRAAMAAVEAFYKDRGIFQGRFGLGQLPALVVIDMAYGWTDPSYAGGSARLDGAVAALQRLLPAARSRGIPIVFTTA